MIKSTVDDIIDWYSYVKLFDDSYWIDTPVECVRVGDIIKFNSLDVDEVTKIKFDTGSNDTEYVLHSYNFARTRISKGHIYKVWSHSHKIEDYEE